MNAASTIEIVRPIEERLDILTQMYGENDVAELIDATERIRQNLGGERTRGAVDHIRNRDFREASRIILDYYDRIYRASIKSRSVSPPEVDTTGLSATEVAKLLIDCKSLAIPTHAITTAG